MYKNENSLVREESCESFAAVYSQYLFVAYENEKRNKVNKTMKFRVSNY